MRGLHVVVCAGASAAILPEALAATTWFVPSGQPSIAAALAVAGDGDTIQLAPGYVEGQPFTLGAKAVTIRGDIANPGLCTIAPSAAPMPVCLSHLDAGKKLVVSGVTFAGTNAYEFHGGQIEISNCRITDSAQTNAPRFLADGASLAVTSTVVASTGDDAGAVLFTVVGGSVAFEALAVQAGAANLLDATAAQVTIDACTVAHVGGAGAVVGVAGGSLAAQELMISATRGGPAVRCVNAGPTLTHVVFEGIGGSSPDDAAYAIDVQGPVGPSCVLASCTFTGNGSAVPNGVAGVGVVAAAHVEIANCRFQGNVDADGPGCLALTGNGAMTNCDFLGNRAVAALGGAVALDGDVQVVACRFESNASGVGAGALHVEGGTATVDGCRFEGNHCDGDAVGVAIRGGGAMLVEAGATASIAASILVENESRVGPDAASSSTGGGGAIVVEGGIVAIDHTWLVANHAFAHASLKGTGSGGACAVRGGTLSLVHATALLNHADGVGGGIAAATGSVLVEQSIVAANGATTGGGLALGGGTGTVIDSRLCGNEPEGVDGPWAIDALTSLECDAISYPGDASTLQAAIASVRGSDVVLIEPGIFHETFDLLGKPVALVAARGPGTVILDGTGAGDAVCRAVSGEASATVVHGLDFRNGVAGSPHERGTRAGGAVYCVDASPTFSSCRFDANAADRGGAFFGSGFNGRIDSCVFNGNTANLDGGGLCLVASDAAVVACLLEANAAGRDGGAVAISGGAASIEGCTIVANVAEELGGGIAFDGLALQAGVETSLVNCTIEGNIAGTGGGGLASESGSQPVVLVLTDVCGNEPNETIGPFLVGPGSEICGCPADVDGDGTVGAGDLAALLGAWGRCDLCAADLDGSGGVDSSDLAILLGAWGSCPS